MTTTNGIKKSSRVGIENKVNYDDKVMELIWKVQTRLSAFSFQNYLFIYLKKEHWYTVWFTLKKKKKKLLFWLT